MTVGENGGPHVGLYPFVLGADIIELHLNRRDEQVADLSRRPRCAFELDEVLASVPSHWLDAENAVFATAYHRSVIFECRARLETDAGVLAAQQKRLLARYQPEGRFRDVSPDDPLYAGMLARLTSVRLEICERRIKFKLGQNRSRAQRLEVARRLRERGRSGDARAAEALEGA